MLEDLYKIQLYKIYYKNTNNIFPSYFQTFTPHYYNALEHGHDLRHNVVRLPLTKREYYVQCAKYQFLKLIRDTSQSDLDRSLTSFLTQFIAYFKGTDQAGTFMSLKCVVYYANYRSWHQSSKIQVVS